VALGGFLLDRPSSMPLGICVKALAILALALGTLLPAGFAAPTESDTSAARAAAAIWLSKLDADQFAESWQLLSSDARKGVSRWRWNFQCKMGRMSLGKARSRTEISAERSAKSPGGRPGEYVLLSYETSSEKKGVVIEHVAVQRDHDHQWRVCSYGVGQEVK
jgi:hypothetical protein